jgi:hypothetical protein
MLANPFRKREQITGFPNLKLPKSPKKIANPANVDKIISEVNALRDTDCSCCKVKLRSVFCRSEKHSKRPTKLVKHEK